MFPGPYGFEGPAQDVTEIDVLNKQQDRSHFGSCKGGEFLIP
jgi:hypothetical protein